VVLSSHIIPVEFAKIVGLLEFVGIAPLYTIKELLAIEHQVAGDMKSWGSHWLIVLGKPLIN
jgi:hypothetical protein